MPDRRSRPARRPTTRRPPTVNLTPPDHPSRPVPPDACELCWTTRRAVVPCERYMAGEPLSEPRVLHLCRGCWGESILAGWAMIPLECPAMGVLYHVSEPCTGLAGDDVPTGAILTVTSAYNVPRVTVIYGDTERDLEPEHRASGAVWHSRMVGRDRAAFRLLRVEPAEAALIIARHRAA